MYKKKRQKQIKDENISSILSFIYLVKGLTDATSQDVTCCPKQQTAKWCCWFDGHCLKAQEYFAPFIKRKSFFLFTHASSPFPLETSGSFFKFNSFLFIYLFIFLNLFIYSFLTDSQSDGLQSFRESILPNAGFCWFCRSFSSGPRF